MAELDPARLMAVADSPYTSRHGRRFAFTLAAAFAVIAAITFWRGSETFSFVAGGIGAVLLIGGVAAPARLGPVERAWMAFARTISRITTPLFMGIVYFVVLTPAGLIRRTFGSNPIVHRGDGGTYWSVRPPKDPEASRRRMERQF